MFDLTNDKAQSFDVLPQGTYHVVCKKTEMKDTKSRDGKYIKCEFEVIEGVHKGRKIWHNFNVQNSNPKAVEIGRGQMKSFLLSAGVKEDQLKSITPTSLEGQVCFVSVLVETDSYGEKNKISSFKKAPGEAGKAPAASAQQSSARPGF